MQVVDDVNTSASWLAPQVLAANVSSQIAGINSISLAVVDWLDASKLASKLCSKQFKSANPSAFVLLGQAGCVKSGGLSQSYELNDEVNPFLMAYFMPLFFRKVP